MPKIELHAHLNGCIRESTLISLAQERDVELSPLLHHPNNQRRSLNECFAIFTEISACVTDLEALRRITLEALQDFAAQNVIYLELRSTPKELWKTRRKTGDESSPVKCTKCEYVKTILEIMEMFHKEEVERYERDKKMMASSQVENTTNGGDGRKQNHSNRTNCKNGATIIRLPLIPRFILSIDRSTNLDIAMEHADLAIQLAQEPNSLLTGVDLGGNPTKNDFRDFEAAFVKIRDADLSISIHCGEIPCGHGNENESQSLLKAYEEAHSIISFQPDRLGHALLLPQNVYDVLNKSPIPIECCPTSNVLTLELSNHAVKSTSKSTISTSTSTPNCPASILEVNSERMKHLAQGLCFHPMLKHWLDKSYPISISTDDFGIFCTDSTQEWKLLVESFDLKNDTSKIVGILMNSIQHSFESDTFKDWLKGVVLERLDLLHDDA